MNKLVPETLLLWALLISRDYDTITISRKYFVPILCSEKNQLAFVIRGSTAVIATPATLTPPLKQQHFNTSHTSYSYGHKLNCVCQSVTGIVCLDKRIILSTTLQNLS